jgi:hypothetical protein
VGSLIQQTFVIPIIQDLFISALLFYESIIQMIANPLNSFLPAIPWADSLAIAIPIVVVIIVVAVLSGRKSKPLRAASEGSLGAVFESIASKETRPYLLDVVRSGLDAQMTKLDELKAKNLLTEYAHAALQGALYENQKSLATVLQPFAATTAELESDLGTLKKQQSDLEAEIAQMQTRLKKPGAPVPEDVSVSADLDQLKADLFEPTKGDGEKLVGEMLSQIRNIADEFGLKEALDALPEE